MTFGYVFDLPSTTRLVHILSFIPKASVLHYLCSPRQLFCSIYPQCLQNNSKIREVSDILNKTCKCLQCLDNLLFISFALSLHNTHRFQLLSLSRQESVFQGSVVVDRDWNRFFCRNSITSIQYPISGPIVLKF